MEKQILKSYIEVIEENIELLKKLHHNMLDLEHLDCKEELKEINKELKKVAEHSFNAVNIVPKIFDKVNIRHRFK